MKILFKNVTKYTDEEMKKFQKFHKNINIKKYNFWKIALTIFFIISFVLNIIYKNWFAAIGTLFLAGILYCYYNYTNPDKKQKNNKRQLNQEFIFEFTNKYIEIKSKKVDNKIAYYKFHRIYETKNNFYLYLDDEYSILINKDGFVIGNVDDFRDFIKKKLIFKYRLEK